MSNRLTGFLGRGKTCALQQQSAIGRHQLEIELAVAFAVLLEAGQRGLGFLGGFLAALRDAQRAQAYGFAQRVHKRLRLGAGAFLADAQGRLDLLGVRHQVIVACAHGRNLGVDLLEQRLLGIAPGDAVGIGAAHGLGLLGRGKGLEELEQCRAFGLFGLARCARVGDDAAHQLAQLIARREQRDGVVVALAHLAAVEPGDGGHVVFDDGLGQREMLAVDVVEAGRDVARHFDMLNLVAPHGHLVGVEDQDVGGHQHRIHEQACRHAVIAVAARLGVLVLRGLVRMGAVEHALAGHAGEEPGELGDFGQRRLAIERHLLGVEPGGQPAGGNLQRRAVHALGVLRLDQRVVVGQKVVALHARIAAGPDGGADHAGVVAQMRSAGRRDAGEEASDGHVGEETKNQEIERGAGSAQQQGAQRRHQQRDDVVAHGHQRLQPQRADHAHDDQTHDDEETIGFEARQPLRLLPGQQPDEHAPAIQRRQRKQVERPHHQIHHHARLGHRQEEAFIHIERQHQNQRQRPQNRLDEVGQRTGQRYPDHVALGIAQMREIHRHRFGIAEQECAGRGEIQQQRHQNRADRINVLDGVQRNAPRHQRRVVAEVPGHIAVRGLVHRDGEQHRQGIDENGLNEVGCVHPDILADMRYQSSERQITLRFGLKNDYKGSDEF
ncbi:hypothetical protein SDC9_81302 [bioreactor metagenome]|uniref:Uncharacterized protein n=1 Tax=bioreactor metagenome TaxID=1076179 RepID=A0A644Z1E9_9ZZZZ